jgi:hypothetical protein
VLMIEDGRQVDRRHITADADGVDGQRWGGRKNHEAQRDLRKAPD